MDIEIRGLTKRYEDKVVLDGFDATFHEGRITCIMGDSGCGKTTLLNMLLGFLEPDAGSIGGLPERIGVVFQEDRLCEAFTAVSNVRLAAGDHLSDEQIISELGKLGITHEDALQPVREFSGGMKRRVAIARAVLFTSDLLVLDEAFKGLDGDTKKTTMDWVKRHAQGRTVISVTHDALEADYFCDELIRMERKA